MVNSFSPQLVPPQQRNTMKHLNQYPEVKNAKANARADACLDIALACIIGIGLAACLFYGLSA
jgi:hypothetical protein